MTDQEMRQCEADVTSAADHQETAIMLETYGGYRSARRHRYLARVTAERAFGLLLRELLS